MNEKTKSVCDLVMKNRNALKKKMFWEIDSNTYAVMAGLLTAAKDVDADPDLYKECKKTLKANISTFSAIRGFIGAVVTVKMMLSDNKQEYIEGVEAVYKKLRSIHKLTASPYMVMAAMNIYESCGVVAADEEIDKLETLYKGLKSRHPLLVSDSDRGYLSMLINMGINVDKAIDNIELNYEACKKITLNKNTAYSLAQILALSNKSAESNCEYVTEVLKGLKSNKKWISKQFGLTVIGALSLLNLDVDKVVEEIVEADNYIKGKKGFKWYNHGKRLRITYAALMVFLANAKDSSVSDNIGSNIAMTITEEIIIAIVIMICASSAASSASSASASS